MNGCIEWAGRSTETHGNRYGYFCEGGATFSAHRRAYEAARGVIPSGMVIDHLCRNGLCINPLHLEAVINKENILRGQGRPARNARKSYCKNGHALTVENTWSRKGRRACKQCDLDRYHSPGYLEAQRKRQCPGG